MRLGQEKSRSSAGTDEPAKAKNIVVGDELGYLDSSARDRLDQDLVMYNAGYSDCHRELAPRIVQLENALRWYVKKSVSNIFENIGFDGAEAARQRSAQRFWQHRKRGAA